MSDAEQVIADVLADLKNRKAADLAAEIAAALRAAGLLPGTGDIVVDVPAIPFPGGSPQADLWRGAAARLEGGYPVGGSNVTRAVVQLLRATAAALSQPHPAQEQPRRRLRTCVENWPDCYEGGYDPHCCRFPKTCSCDVYDPERVTDADLEPAQEQQT